MVGLEKRRTGKASGLDKGSFDEMGVTAAPVAHSCVSGLHPVRPPADGVDVRVSTASPCRWSGAARAAKCLLSGRLVRLRPDRRLSVTRRASSPVHSVDPRAREVGRGRRCLRSGGWLSIPAMCAHTQGSAAYAASQVLRCPPCQGVVVWA
jgi:hypothetical protein